MRTEKTIELKLTGSNELLRAILGLLHKLQFNGAVGHSGYWWVSCDGDGSDYLKIEPKELYKHDDFGNGEIPPYIMQKVFEARARKRANKERV